MSFRLIVLAKDEQYEGALANAVAAENARSDMNPEARRALSAAGEFARGAVINAPKGTTIEARINGHIENVTGYGEVNVRIRLGPTPVEADPEPANPEE